MSLPKERNKSGWTCEIYIIHDNYCVNHHKYSEIMRHRFTSTGRFHFFSPEKWNNSWTCAHSWSGLRCGKRSVCEPSPTPSTRCRQLPVVGGLPQSTSQADRQSPRFRLSVWSCFLAWRRGERHVSKMQRSHHVRFGTLEIEPKINFK